jgi:hypothetical protein
MVLAVVATVAEDDSDSMHSADERVAARPVALPYAVVVAVEVVDYFYSVATALETTHQMTERTHRPNRDAEAAAWLIFYPTIDTAKRLRSICSRSSFLSLLDSPGSSYPCLALIVAKDRTGCCAHRTFV